MGYYVKIRKSTAKLPKRNEAAAYAAMCALNVTHDNVKRGGSWGNGKQEAKWFSWMDANYPDTCKDAGEIFEALGFDITRGDDGITLDYYDSKTGQEDLFLKSIENLVEGRIDWIGEDGDLFETVFQGDNVIDGSVERNALEYNGEQPHAGELVNKNQTFLL